MTLLHCGSRGYQPTGHLSKDYQVPLDFIPCEAKVERNSSILFSFKFPFLEKLTRLQCEAKAAGSHFHLSVIPSSKTPII